MHLTHWGQVTHICFSKLTIIVSDNGFVAWTNDWILSTDLSNRLQRNLNRKVEICMQENAIENVVTKLETILSRPQYVKNAVSKSAPFCSGLNVLTLSMGETELSWLTRSISGLLMPWLLASPGHQQPWYWLCKIDKSWSYTRKDFNYLWHVSVEEWHKM